ncbi:hypothetical protein O5D80_004443 [Batrachochytrium dendrobatidis]|nr:hypothetical protein O5D80_004443 [Batrachochytrium dendrobatidis]
MKLAHISVFTVAVLVTSVHGIWPKSRQTPNPVGPSLNRESLPQATGGPERPSTSTTTHDLGGNQGGHSCQSFWSRLKSSKLSKLLCSIGKRRKSGHRKDKKKPKYGRNDGSIDSLLMSLLKLPRFSQSGHQGGAQGSKYLVKENSKQHRRVAKAIEKDMNIKANPQETGFRKDLSVYWSNLGGYEKWIKDILDFNLRFEATSKLTLEFIEDFGLIFEKLLEMIRALRGEFYRQVLRLNKDPSQFEDVIEDILDLVNQFISRQEDAQELFARVFGRHSKIDWYSTNLRPQLILWSESLE